MPYYDAAGALEIAEQMMRPWCELPPVSAFAAIPWPRGPSHATDCSRSSPVSCGPRAALHGAGSSAGCSSAHWQTSAALVLPPGHHRGTRGSIYRWIRAKNALVLYATTLRETSCPSAALACQAGRRPEGKTAFCCTFCRHLRDGAQRPAHWVGLPRPCSNCAFSPRKPEPIAAPLSSRLSPSAILNRSSRPGGERHASLIVLGAARSPAFRDFLVATTRPPVLAHARLSCYCMLREPQAMPEGTAHAVTATPSLVPHDEVLLVMDR